MRRVPYYQPGPLITTRRILGMLILLALGFALAYLIVERFPR